MDTSIQSFKLPGSWSPYSIDHCFLVFFTRHSEKMELPSLGACTCQLMFMGPVSSYPICLWANSFTAGSVETPLTIGLKFVNFLDSNSYFMHIHSGSISYVAPYFMQHVALINACVTVLCNSLFFGLTGLSTMFWLGLCMMWFKWNFYTKQPSSMHQMVLTSLNQTKVQPANSMCGQCNSYVIKCSMMIMTQLSDFQRNLMKKKPRDGVQTGGRCYTLQSLILT